MSQSAGADCKNAEPPQEAPDFVESVAKGEAGVMSLGCMFDDFPHPVEPLRGGTQVELSPGVEAVGVSTQSAPQLCLMYQVAAEGGETLDSAGEVGVSSPY